MKSVYTEFKNVFETKKIEHKPANRYALYLTLMIVTSVILLVS